jgi:putative effector of murein hydrolase LrgA (UPF0299 family)
MIASLSVILTCQLIGEVVVRGLRLPLPGPVIGMALLFAALIVRDRVPALALGPLRDSAVEGMAKGLLANLSLMFVPAGVGVIQNLDLLAQRGLAIAAVLAGSVVVTLLVTVGTFLVINRLMERGRKSS